MARFFSSDNWYWKPFSVVADTFLLSCTWTLCSIPLVTCGAATTALYDTVAHCVRGNDKDLFGRFFSTFKREFLPSLCSSAMWAAILIVLFRLIRAFAGTLPDTNCSVMIVAGLFFLFSVVVGIFSWVLPLLSRFTFSFGALNITAVRLACGHPFRTIGSGITTMLSVCLCMKTGFLLMLIPEILAVIWAFLMEPIFKKYMTDEEKTAVEKCPDDKEDSSEN